MTTETLSLPLSDLIEGADFPVTVEGVTSDSRQAGPGYLFAALPGVKVDGSQFIPEVIRKGVRVIICAADAVVPEHHDVVVIRDKNPRQLFSKVVARYFSKQPDYIVAVTGTNGKTSTVHFCRQIWKELGLKSASIGTIGIADYQGKFAYERANFLTTPDTVKLHHIMMKLVESDITHLAMEASSHGLDQYRLDGVRIKAAAFTNLTRDHLDYHQTMEAYLQAKSRLFSEVLEEGGTAVLNADESASAALSAICRKRRLKVFSYGRTEADIRIMDIAHEGLDQLVQIKINGHVYRSRIALTGEFQISNLACAIGLVMASGYKPDAIMAVLDRVTSVPGRMERVLPQHPRGATVFVDYAHTPDALEKALSVLRPYVKGKLWVVFGCGGDRDKGKRPQMGKIAAELADRVVVTDDNPRSEDPAVIRKEILSQCRDAKETGDREEAITYAITHLQKGDILLIAGKGHEKIQVIGDEVLPFDDVQVAAKIIEGIRK